MAEQYAAFFFDGQMRIGRCIKANAKTLWVQLDDGSIIQRHRLKHQAGLLTSHASVS